MSSTALVFITPPPPGTHCFCIKGVGLPVSTSVSRGDRGGADRAAAPSRVLGPRRCRCVIYIIMRNDQGCAENALLGPDSITDVCGVNIWADSIFNAASV